jgi:aspartyl-tRNA(Asn)/glutamyl-tRNA(Gln) amidotransferase subunit B
MAKDVFAEIFKHNVDPVAYVEQNGLAMLNDDSLVEKTVNEVIAANTKSVEDYKNGKDKALGYLVGCTMKALKGKADPQVVNKILLEKLKA